MAKTVLLYQEICPDSAKAFVEEFSELEGSGESINVRFNSPGGSVLDGLAAYNCIKRSTVPTTAYIDGVVASMATIVTCACTRIGISKVARYMIHKPSGNSYGKSDDIREYADVLDSLESTMLDIYAGRTGKDPEWIKINWLDGKDHWFTAQEALSHNLVDFIYDDDIEAPDGVSEADYHSYFTAHLSHYNANQTQKTNMKQLIMRLNVFMALAKLQPITETAGEAEIVDSFKALSDANMAKDQKIADLQGRITAYEANEATARKSAIKEMIDAAIAAKKFTEAQRAQYEALAAANFDTTKAVIDSMHSVMDAKSFVKAGEAKKDGREDWSFEDYTKKDPAALAIMRVDNPDAYKALYDAQYSPNN